MPMERDGVKVVMVTAALALAGCASDLPYSIAIDHPISPQSQKVHEKDCVLRLSPLVAEFVGSRPAEQWQIRVLQREFETRLGSAVNESRTCKDNNYHPPTAYESGIEDVAKKWLVTYSLDATDPDQSLERFREFLLSSIEAKRLSATSLKPDESEPDTYYLVEKRSMRQSQWCGELTEETYREIHIPLLSSLMETQAVQQQKATRGPEHVSPRAPEPTSCLDQRSLYRIMTNLARDQKSATDQQELYDQLLEEVVQGQMKGQARNVRYLVLGYEIPWDKDQTLVRYGVTFYFRETELPGKDRSSKASPSSHHERATQLIGYDLIYANEATPEPQLAEHESTEPPDQSGPSPWSKNWWRVTGYPFSIAIGVKNAAFELAKLPLSWIPGVLFGRDAPNYPLENLITAYNALHVEATTQTRGGLEAGLYRLLTEVPFVGQMFQYNFGADHSEGDDLSRSEEVRRKLFLSRGIYGGNKWGQDTGLWASMAKEAYPTYDVYSPPYRHGTVLDVAWSMFNLSHGPAYSEARYITDHATRKDRLYLAGHSGGVQRSAAASRILWHHGYRVIKVMGVAGPSIGQAFVDDRYPDAFRVYLNSGSGANQDIVSKVGMVAGAFSTVLDYGVIAPLKYTVGGLFTWNGPVRDRIYRTADRIGFTNATIVEVERKPSSQHQTPFRLSLTDRLVFDAYLRNEFETMFREDLERPEIPDHERPNAIQWER